LRYDEEAAICAAINNGDDDVSIGIVARMGRAMVQVEHELEASA